MYFFPV